MPFNIALRLIMIAAVVTVLQSWPTIWWILIFGIVGAICGFFLIRLQADNLIEGTLGYGLPCVFVAGVAASMNGGWLLDAAFMMLYPVVGVLLSSFTDRRRRASSFGLESILARNKKQNEAANQDDDPPADEGAGDTSADPDDP